MGGPSAEPFGNERDLPQKTNEITNLGGAFPEPFGSPRRICPREPETPRSLGETFRGTFWQPKTDLPQRTGDTTKPWWNLPRNLLAAQDGSAPENRRHHETWRTGGALVKPSAEPFGSPRRICPREPETPRNLENLGGALVKPSAEPFGSPRRIYPRKP